MSEPFLSIKICIGTDPSCGIFSRSIRREGMMRQMLLERRQGETLVMSGAMGTVMHQMGADLGGCIHQWIVEHPEVFRELVRDYFRVGGDIVAGATSNLNRISLAQFGRAGGELRLGVLRTTDGP